jgi:predicted MFS family arabinose efflux permease
MTSPTGTGSHRRTDPRPPRLPAAVWAAGGVTFLASSADNFVLFLLLWIAQPQGWSGSRTALVVLVLRLPSLFSGILLGRAVDRWGARPIMLLDLGARTVLLLLLAVSARHATLPLLPVLVLGGLCAAASPATYAGVRALIPHLVADQQLGRANALVSLGDQLPLLVGTALVGPSLAVLGIAASLLVPVAFLAVALLLARMLPRGWARVSAAAARSGDGHRPGRRRPSRVVALIGLSTVYYFAYGPFETASPEFVRVQLGAGEGVYSLLWALFGIGALSTVLLGAFLARRRPGVVNALGALSWGLVMLPVAALHSVPVVAGFFLVGGAIWGPYTAVETTALQRWVDPSRHGAVFGVQRSLLASATPLGAALGALGVERFSAGPVLAASAGACGAAGLLALAHRDLRRAR